MRAKIANRFAIFAILPPKCSAGSTRSAAGVANLWRKKRREAREAPPRWRKYGGYTGGFRCCATLAVFLHVAGVNRRRCRRLIYDPVLLL